MSVRRLIFDDADPAMVYSGSWTTGTTLSQNTNEYNSTYHRSGTVGDSVLFTFEGTGIDVYATLDHPATQGAPSPLFTMDNGSPVRFDTSSLSGNDNVTSHYAVMRYNDLSQGEHTLDITVEGVSPSGPYFYFDFAVVTTNDLDAPGYVIVDDQDRDIFYDNTWVTEIGESDFRNTVSTVAGRDSVCTLTFNGTEVAVYGTITPSTNSTAVARIGFMIDGKMGDTFNGPPDLRGVHHIQFLHATDLKPRDNTLIMNQLGSKGFALDYIVYKTTNYVSTTRSQSHKKTNTGAIVGGVVGGVAFIAILAIAAFVILRRRQGNSKKGAS
ncbi:hypothetical protein CPB86DRAFT_764620 [Serendipita vermifera]|nr:hypothetical protein CPB86DRAFT_764620 [Serendipita vermifera]